MRVNGRIISWRNNREGENENPVSRRIYRYHKYPVTKFSLAFQFSPNTIRKLSGQWIDPYIRTYVHTHSCILQRALQNLHLLEIPKISLFQIYIITRLTSFLETMKDIRVSHKFLSSFFFLSYEMKLHDICRLRLIYCVTYEPFYSITFFHLSKSIHYFLFPKLGLFAKYSSRCVFISFIGIVFYGKKLF